MKKSIFTRILVSSFFGVVVGLVSLYVIMQKEWDHRAVARLAINLNEVHSDGMAKTNDLKYSWNQRTMPMQLVNTIGRRDSIEKALVSMGKTPSDEHVVDVMKRIKVRLIPGTQAIEVSYMHSSREEALNLIGNLIDIEIECVIQKKRYDIEVLLEELQARRRESLSELENATGEMVHFESEKPVSPIYRLASLKSKLVDLEIEQIITKNELLFLHKPWQGHHFVGVAPIIAQISEEKVEVDLSGYAGVWRHYFDAVVEQQVIAKRYGSNSQQFREKMVEVQILKIGLKELIETYKRILRSKIAANEKSQIALEAELGAVEAKITSVEEKENSFQRVSTDLYINALTQKLERFDNRVSELRVSRNAIQPHLILLDSPYIETKSEVFLKRSSFALSFIGCFFIAVATFMITDWDRTRRVF